MCAAPLFWETATPDAMIEIISETAKTNFMGIPPACDDSPGFSCLKMWRHGGRLGGGADNTAHQADWDIGTHGFNITTIFFF